MMRQVAQFGLGPDKLQNTLPAAAEGRTGGTFLWRAAEFQVGDVQPKPLILQS